MAEKVIIKIKGQLNENWKEWFEGMEITYDGEVATLSGERIYNAFLHGILNRIRDLNLNLISVTPE